MSDNTNFWVVKKSDLYFNKIINNKVDFCKDINSANRYFSERDAKFIAKKCGGEPVSCSITFKGVVECV